MEIWENDLNDYEKYAFLLGTSLRNNDLEHFFGTYDNVLPKHLSDTKLELIKERARIIAELPDKEFDGLVVKARDFSLAGHPLTMNRHCDDRTSDSEDEDGQKRLTISKLLSDEMNHSLDIHLKCSSKDTVGYKYSSSDPEESDVERGVIDYCPQQTSDAEKISANFSPHYDEAHDVESDKSSVDSPRSVASSTREYDVTTPQDESNIGIEMRTFKSEDCCSSDGETCDNSHSDVSYRRLQEESDGDCTLDNSSIRSSLHKSMQTGNTLQSVHSLANGTVDQYERNEKLFTRDGKEIECSGPPFGYKNQLSKVGESIPKLLKNDLSDGSIPPNMPEGELLKKKRKKKKGSKDDSNEHLSERSRKSIVDDINGNRLDHLSLAGYMQMRESPCTESSSQIRQGNGTCSSQNKQNSDCDISGPGQADRDADSSSGNPDSKKKQRRRKSEEPVKLAGDFPDYVGNKYSEIDELVQFIEKGEKQLKKKLNRKNTPEVIVTKPEKLSKKHKDKKDQVKSFESADILVSGEQPVGSSSSSSSSFNTASEDMGNSSEKPSTNTNEKNNPDETDTAKEDNVKVLKSVDGKTLKPETIAAEDKNNKVHNQTDKVITSKFVYPIKKEGELKDKNKTKPGKEKTTEIQETNKKIIKTDETDNSKKSNKLKVKSELQVKNNKKVDNMVVENGPSQVGTDRDLSTSPNTSSFIFTDIDPPPPLEAEFIVVSKTKKKKRSSENTKHRNSTKEHKISHPRSSTPPAFPVTVANKDKTRDLSPSAFPPIGFKCASTKVRPCLREGRRNSVGDVPIDSGSFRSLDDSDIESVKSLPAAQGGRLSDVASSRFPVSYAKMAATPKPPSSPNSSVPLSPGSCDDDMLSPKTTVWKGSLHERRHSIGSSPEDSKPDISPKFSQRIRQKSGSQDVLKVDKVETLQIELKVFDVSDEILTTEKVMVTNNKINDDTKSSEQKPLLKNVVVHSAEEKLPSDDNTTRLTSITFAGGSHMPPFVLKGEKLDGPKKYIKSVVSNTNETSRSHTVDNSKNISTNVVSDSCSGKSIVNSSVIKDTANKPTNVIKFTNNGRKPKSSVVFLDKRFIETPQKLDITFGFDSNLEKDNQVVKEPDRSDPETSDSKCVSQSSSPVVVSVTAAAAPSDDKMVSNVGQSIHLTSSVPAGCVKNFKTSSNANEPDDDSSHKFQSLMLGKLAKSHIAGLNGVVQSHSQGYKNKSTPDTLRTETNTSEKSESVNSNHDKPIIITYGEGIQAKTGDSQICMAKRKQIKFIPDNNITASKFNATDAIAFLKKEWENVLELKEKNPKTVIFYDGQ